MNPDDSTNLNGALRGITAAGSPSILLIVGFFIGTWLFFAMIAFYSERRMLNAWAAKRHMQIVSLKRRWFFTGPFFGFGPAWLVTVLKNGHRQTGYFRFRPASSRENRIVVHWTFPAPSNAP